MLALLAFLCFFVDFIMHGTGGSFHSSWLDQSGLLYLGLTFAALSWFVHVPPVELPFRLRRRP